MNAKKARALRKQAEYHPSDDREYSTMKVYSLAGRVTEYKRTKVNAEKTSRAKYRELKREATRG